MTSLSCSSEYASVTCGMKTFILRLSDNNLSTIDHSDAVAKISHKCEVDTPMNMNIKKKDSHKTSHPDNDDLRLSLLCSDISPSGNFLAFCTYSKYLCIVNLNQQNLVLSNVYRLSRGASKIKFTPKTENIVVADKSGDVHLFRIKEENSKSQLILGHLSLLLDVLVTSDEKIIITSDRDEKIRVSCFPNGYNIIAFCLGHLEFVSSLGFLPHNNSNIFSTSGDGTLRFWDFKKGSELLVCNVYSYITSPGRSCEINDKDVAAITDSKSIYVNECQSLICICVENFNMCVTVMCSTVENKLQYSICEYIPFGDLSPWRANVSSNSLWILLNSNDKSFIKSMVLNSDTHHLEVNSQVADSVNLLNNQNMCTDIKKNIVGLLYKKKFDNVLEYLRKKDEKCASGSEPSNKKMKQ